jgi:hypothetical protein
LGPVTWDLALAEGAETPALYAVQGLNAGPVQEGLGEIHIGDDLVTSAAGGDLLRVAHQHWHAQAFLVHEALVKPAVLTQKETLVGGVDDDGVVAETEFVEKVKEAAGAFVDGSDTAQVILDVGVVLPLRLFHLAQTLRHRHFEVLELVHVIEHPHSHGLGGIGAGRVVIPEGLRERNVDIGVELLVALCRLPMTVVRLVMTHQGEGFVFITITDEILTQIGDDIGDVTVDLFAAIGADELRVPVVALTG